MYKVGDTFFHGKLEYVVDEVNSDGTCNSHLVKVHGANEVVNTPATPSESPVEDVKETEPVEITAPKTETPTKAKSTTTRKRSTTKKTTSKK